MKLFVGNPTRQKQEFYYRLDMGRDGALLDLRGTPARVQTIMPGRQTVIGGDLDHVSQVDCILDQLKRFGATAYTELDRVKTFVPYVYSVEKPVPAKALEKAYYHNQAVLTGDGEARRKAAAIAVSSFVDSPETKVSFEEVGTMAGEDMGGSKIAEGYIVDKMNDPKGKK